MTAINLSYTCSLILQLFSYIYWSYGADGNFNVTLTHLDSFYVALGTFTTAGTGNIAPLSETTRGFQTLQMGIDFIFLGFVVVLVMTRYTNLLDRARATPDEAPNSSTRCASGTLTLDPLPARPADASPPNKTDAIERTPDGTRHVSGDVSTHDALPSAETDAAASDDESEP